VGPRSAKFGGSGPPRRWRAEGVPLVLVECKDTSKGPDAGVGQVRSFSFWIKPAYYVITNGDLLTVYNYQGGAVPDVKVLEVKRADLREQFDDLYRVLNPSAAAEARRDKIAKLTPTAHQTQSLAEGRQFDPAPDHHSKAMLQGSDQGKHESRPRAAETVA
jgi:hypothetical protein